MSAGQRPRTLTFGRDEQAIGVGEKMLWGLLFGIPSGWAVAALVFFAVVSVLDPNANLLSAMGMRLFLGAVLMVTGWVR